MTKSEMFCDKCGKLIPDKVNWYSVQIIKQPNIWVQSCDYKYDICMECMSTLPVSNKPPVLPL